MAFIDGRLHESRRAQDAADAEEIQPAIDHWLSQSEPESGVVDTSLGEALLSRCHCPRASRAGPGHGGLGSGIGSPKQWLQLPKNAVRFTQEGMLIRIGGALEDGQVRPRVDDTAAGVAPEDVDRIFQRFSYGTGAGSDGGGTGLGLAIVAAIARAHQGSARLVPRPGPGARFEITFPTRSIQASDRPELVAPIAWLADFHGVLACWEGD